MTQATVQLENSQFPRWHGPHPRARHGLRRLGAGLAAAAVLWLSAAGTAFADGHAESVDHEHLAGFHNGAPGHEHLAGFHNGAPGHEHLAGFHHEAP